MKRRHDAPTKGSVPAEKMKKAKTVGNDEVQDGGAAVVKADASCRLMLPLIKQQRYLVMHSKRMRADDPMQKIKRSEQAAHEDEDEDEKMMRRRGRRTEDEMAYDQIEMLICIQENGRYE